MSRRIRPRQPQQVLTTVVVAGPQDITITSHDDRWNSWVGVAVGQVLTYAVGLPAPESIARIWTEAEERTSALLPLTVPMRRQPPVDGPSVVVRLTGDQSTERRSFPYDGRTGATHILIGGILWRPIDCAALTDIANAWRRAATIAHALVDE